MVLYEEYQIERFYRFISYSINHEYKTKCVVTFNLHVTNTGGRRRESRIKTYTIFALRVGTVVTTQ